MTIKAKIIEDSICGGCPRLITMELTYPRFIHSEFMTHRVFSRNASSSRAIPIEKMIQAVLDDPAVPVHWGVNKPGMQAGEEQAKLVPCYPIDEGEVSFDERSPQAAWLLARDYAVISARGFSEAGYHKQIANRLLEPFAHITVVVTATEWDNFFELRRHGDADPTIQALANAMWEAQEKSEPNQIFPDEAHLPYLVGEERQCLDRMKISAARCARVSYLTHDGKVPSREADLTLYDRLVGSAPMHASPLEHQAQPDPWSASPHLYGNLRGWVQYRQTVAV